MTQTSSFRWISPELRWMLGDLQSLLIKISEHLLPQKNTRRRKKTACRSLGIFCVLCACRNATICSSGLAEIAAAEVAGLLEIPDSGNLRCQVVGVLSEVRGFSRSGDTDEFVLTAIL